MIRMSFGGSEIYYILTEDGYGVVAGKDVDEREDGAYIKGAKIKECRKVDIGDLGVRELSQRTIGSIVNEINRSYRNTINNGGAAVCHECLSITRDAREIIGLDGVKFYCKDCIDSKDILSRCVVCGKRLREKGKLQEENRDNKLCMCKECYDGYYSPSKYEEESMVESIGMGEGRKLVDMTEDEFNKWIHYRPLRPEQIERLVKIKEVKGGKR